MRPTRATYRRRRLGALLAAGVLVLALHAGGNAGAETPAARHTVLPGETLWEITVSHYPPSEDPRVRIEEIRASNGLEDYRIRPGTTLKLPPVE